jgi:hypothetical protein
MVNNGEGEKRTIKSGLFPSVWVLFNGVNPLVSKDIHVGILQGFCIPPQLLQDADAVLVLPSEKNKERAWQHLN